MKKLLIGLLVLGSFFTFASCDLHINMDTAYENIRESNKIKNKVITVMAKKGFENISYTFGDRAVSNKDYTLNLLIGMVSQYRVNLTNEFDGSSEVIIQNNFLAGQQKIVRMIKKLDATCN